MAECDHDDLGLSVKNWRYFLKTHLVTMLNQIRAQHVNLILYPANIWMEKIPYHTALSSVNNFTRKEITDTIAMGSMVKPMSLLTLFFAAVGWNPVLKLQAMLIIIVVVVQD